MIKVTCKQCEKDFFTRPSLIKREWGIFCSRKCQYQSLRSGKDMPCDSCGKEVHRTFKQISCSKSGKFFCTKSCQTQWRNKEYSGQKHTNWKDGLSTYRKDLIRSNLLQVCKLCKESDSRVLAVHHIDEDHSNNKLENLIWLCHNCHHLVHCDSVEKQRLQDVL